MPITRDPQNLYGLVEWTKEINELDRQFAIVPDSMFEQFNTTQTAIVFDKDERTTTLLPAVSRSPRGSTYNQDRTFKTFSLPLAYFKHSDYLTPEDIQSVRMVGTPDGAEKVDVARARKIEQMRRDYDQTMEYMKFRTVTQGKCVSPDGGFEVDLFSEFGITQTEVTWDLTDTSFDLSVAIRDVRRKVRDGMKNGGVMLDPIIYLESTDFDALVTHANVKEAYKYFQADVNVMRDNLLDGFRHAGTWIYPLDGAFNLPSGVSEDIMTVNEGYALPQSGIFRMYSGPANTLSGANGGAVADVYLNEWADKKDQYLEFQMESSPLMMVTNPAALIKINIVTA